MDRRQQRWRDEYQDYIENSQYWKEARAAVWRRDKGVCQHCKRRAGQGDQFHVHHVSYRAPDGHSIVGREKQFLHLLKLLCHDCHKEEHERPLTLAQFAEFVRTWKPPVF